MLPKNRNRGSSAVFTNWALIDLIFGWSGATPERTSPHGVGSISSMSTATSNSSDASAAFSKDAAAKNPDGPEPTMATWNGRILKPSVHALPRRKGAENGLGVAVAGAHDGDLMLDAEPRQMAEVPHVVT